MGVFTMKITKFKDQTWYDFYYRDKHLLWISL